MRRFHEGVDRFHVALTSRLLPPLLRHGVASPCLREHLAAVQLDVPPLTHDRYQALTAHTLVGEVQTGFQVRWGPRRELPMVVYHHGIAEMPYDKSFRGIFRVEFSDVAHRVAVRAPFHRSWVDVARGLTTLGHFLAMCAVSVNLIEAIRLRLAERGARGCLVTGTSLGGFVALLHHLFYGTADRYVPLLAGPDLAHVMLDTHYRRFLAPSALAQAALIRERLDFRQALQASDTQRLFPLLARYDLGVQVAYHQACYTACGVPVVTIDRGHITGSLSFTRLRRHLLACLRTLSPTSREA